jgi:hypothetical protein
MAKARVVMAQSRKIIVNVAISTDEYIAQVDGSVDWLSRSSH